MFSYGIAVAQIDADNDGMDDAWEVANWLDPEDPKDAWCDFDNDQILNLFEFQLQTDPCNFASPPIRLFTTQNTQEEFTGLMNSGIGDLVVIRMSAGTYNLFYDINSSGGAIASSDYKIMIQGGWNSNFTEYDPFQYSTILDGQDSQNILVLDTRENQQVTFIMDGIEVTNSGNGVKEGAIKCIDWAGTSKLSFYNCSFYNNGYANDLSSNSGVALGILWSQEMTKSDFFLVNSSIVNNRNGLYGQLSSFTTGRWHIINTTITNATQNSVLEIEGTSQIPQAINIYAVNSILWEDSIDFPIQFPAALNTQLNVNFSVIGFIENTDNLLETNFYPIIRIPPEFIDTTVNHFELQAQNLLKDSGIITGLPYNGDQPEIGVNQKVLSQIKIDTIITLPTCLANDGSIEIIALDETGNLSFSLNEVDYQTEFVFNNLAAGSYMLYVRSEATCQKMKLPFKLEEAEGQLREETATFCSNQEYLLPDERVVTEPGIYNSLITNGANCEVLIQTTLTELPPFETEIFTTICEGETYTLPDDREVDASDVYTSIFQSSQGCDSVIITNLSFDEAPFIEEEVSICAGDIYTLRDNTITEEAGLYVVELIDPTTACRTTYETTLSINDVFQTTQDIAICEGETHTLPDGREVSATDVYASVFQSSQGCDSVIITNLSFDAAPFIETEANICAGEVYVLEDGRNVETAGMYTAEITNLATGCLTTYQTNLSIDDSVLTIEDTTICEGQNYVLPNGRAVNAAGTYESNLVSTQGCDSTISTNLSISSIEIDLPEEILLQLDAVKLTNTVQSLNPVEYLWSPPKGLSCIDCREPVVILNETTNYLLEVTDTISGCKASATVSVIIVKSEPVVPNAFSPNSDGINDRLIPLNILPETNFLFTVYNRWGQKLFETSNINTYWDGSFKNYKQPMGVYVWFLQYQKTDGTIVKKKGNVTLIN